MSLLPFLLSGSKLGLDKLSNFWYTCNTMAKTTPKRVHDAILTVRVKRQLIEDARAEAHRRGASLSELVRGFLRELAKGS
jgi:predicted HicB family RNase H-like nuclease